MYGKIPNGMTTAVQHLTKKQERAALYINLYYDTHNVSNISISNRGVCEERYTNLHHDTLCVSRTTTSTRKKSEERDVNRPVPAKYPPCDEREASSGMSSATKTNI